MVSFPWLLAARSACIGGMADGWQAPRPTWNIRSGPANNYTILWVFHPWVGEAADAIDGCVADGTLVQKVLIDGVEVGSYGALLTVSAERRGLCG